MGYLVETHHKDSNPVKYKCFRSGRTAYLTKITAEFPLQMLSRKIAYSVH